MLLLRHAFKQCSVMFGYLKPELPQALAGMQVMRGLNSVLDEGSVMRRDDIGVTVVRAPQPLHYYSLFSWSTGTDVVVSVYDGNRYEVECKYTQFVNVCSRPVWPRVSMGALTDVRPRPLLLVYHILPSLLA